MYQRATNVFLTCQRNGVVMPSPISPLHSGQTFCFQCTPEVACFNACCRDLHQVLTPYDVLRLKQYLQLASGTFLKTFTERGTGPDTGLPVVALRFKDRADLTCPFVTASGCRVYPARPASCRTYPLARGVSRDRKTGALAEHWAVIREPHCLGFNADTTQTVDRWVADQQIALHNRMNDLMLALIADKNRYRPGPLGPGESQAVYTALYDLDRFRQQLCATGAAADPGVAPPVGDAPEDDLALLRIAMDWVRRRIFAAPSGGR
jgi:Fe-S-cluster containining protein